MAEQEREQQRFLDYEGAAYIITELQKKIDKKANSKDITPYVLPIATPNVLGGVKVGSGLKTSENGVLSIDGELNATVSWDEVQNKPTSLAGLGIEDGVTKEELAAVEQKVSKAYHHGGNVETYDDLFLIENPEDGIVYNVLDTGENYAWNASDETWDNLGPLMDLSNYLRYQDLVALTKQDLDIIMGIAKDSEAFTTILQNKSEVDVDDDFELTVPVVIGSGKTVRINLNDSTITTSQREPFVADGGTIIFSGNGGIQGNNAYIANAINGGQIIVESGTYDSADKPFTATGKNSKVTINGGTLSGQEAVVMAFKGAAIDINGGTLTARDNFAVGTNGKENFGGNTITMNGGMLVGYITSPGYEAIGVYIANDDIFIMNGGEIYAHNGAGICMRGGHVLINDGTIVATGTAGTTGKIGDHPAGMSKSGIIYHQLAHYPGGYDMRLEIKGGTIIGVDHSVEVLSDEEQPSVIVTGGQFNPAYPNT